MCQRRRGCVEPVLLCRCCIVSTTTIITHHYRQDYRQKEMIRCANYYYCFSSVRPLYIDSPLLVSEPSFSSSFRLLVYYHTCVFSFTPNGFDNSFTLLLYCHIFRTLCSNFISSTQRQIFSVTYYLFVPFLPRHSVEIRLCSSSSSLHSCKCLYY